MQIHELNAEACGLGLRVPSLEQSEGIGFMLSGVDLS